MTDEHLTKVDIDWLLPLLEADNQDMKYVRPFQAALKELKAARSALYFAQLLVDSVIRYTDGDVTINMIHVETLRDYLQEYDEVVGD